MPETLNRNYKGKDVEMLTALATIVDAAIEHKDVLQAKRSNWADPYFQNVQKKIDDIVQKWLGVDSAKELRQATTAVTGLQAKAKNDLQELKVQLTEDFKKDPARRAEILKQLGFADYNKQVQNDDQEALVQMLFQFKKNLTDPLKNEITGKGTSPAILTAITGYADTLFSANVSQETFKGSRKSTTAGAIKAYNEIYDEVISISKMAARFLKDDADLKNKFNYSKSVSVQNSLGTLAKPAPKAKTEKAA